jgi:glycine betaine/proline transport system ATP-binding protein
MNAAINFKSVDILFVHVGHDAIRRRRDALAALDQGCTRDEIQQRYGVVLGVADANLVVAPGEISVLMGLSGSGKSTLLRAANGLNRVTRGTVMIADGDSSVDVANCDDAQLRRVRRQRIAMVFQQFGLLPWRTVRANVGFGLEIRGERAQSLTKIVDEKLELVGLQQWADRFVGELSGGMQQRVGLARAFATDADILLMDEPFSALDPLIRAKLQDELLELQLRVKKTILFVSHDLDEALKLGDRVSMLQHGRIVQTGTAEDIVLSPADDYVTEFVRHMNPLNVLTGGMIMRRRAQLHGDGDVLWLDEARRYRLRIGTGGGPSSLQIDGVAHAVRTIVNEEQVSHLALALAVVPASLPLRAIVRCRQISGHPVLIADGAHVLGVCGEAEILYALSGKLRRSASSPVLT